MSSSGSCDDFESADEDFSETESSSTKTHHKPGELHSDVPEVKQAEPPDKNTENIHKLINSMTIDNQDNHQTPRYAECETQHVVNSSLKLDNCDQTQPKPVKKLGTKLNKKVDNSSTFHLREEVRNDQKKDNDDINDNRSHIKTVGSSETNKNVNMKIVEDKSLQKINSNSEKLILSNSQSSDGWEVEEEDGFEIPSELAKPIPSGVNQFGNKEQQDYSWGSWGGWGVSSLLTTATDSVSTFSSQVTAGLSTVLETTVGAPEPEKLAAAIQRHQNEPFESKKVEETSQSGDDNTTNNYGGLGSLMSGVSLLGSSVINRGLDTLESLGKKTMEVLQEGDPGLKKKRAMLFANEDKPVLSQILREAKEKAEHSDKEKEEKEMARKVHFESLFDDFQGMVHLEALEMLSTQCQLKLQSLLLGESGPALEDLQETLSQVQDLCDLSDEEDETEVLTHDQFAEQVTKCVSRLRVNITTAKIIQVNQSVISTLERLGLDSESATVVHQTAISSLAEFTATAMECFHKSAELLMAKTLHNTADEAEGYVQLTSILCARVSAMANEFTQLLTKSHPIANSSLITNIFLEASNSSSYTRNACQLLVPILQVGAVTS